MLFRIICISAFLGFPHPALADTPLSQLECSEIDARLSTEKDETARERLVLAANACQLPLDDLSVAGALTILDGKDFAVQREGDDVMTMVAKGFEKAPQLCCSVQGTMKPVGDDIWALRYRLARLDEAMLFLFANNEAHPEVDYDAIARWRGPKAPPPLASPPPPQSVDELGRKIEPREVWSDALGETRRVDIYVPPHDGDLSDLKIVIAADGLLGYLFSVDKLIADRELAPAIFIGLPSGQDGIVEDRSDVDYDIRAADYLPGYGAAPERFEKHQAFVFDELLPALIEEKGLSSNREDVIVTGESNGAVFALFSALQHPDKVGGAIVNSAGLGDHLAEPGPPAPRARFFMTAGLYEPGFLLSTRASAEILRDAGYDVTFTDYAAGHAPDQWEVAFIAGLKALTGAGRETGNQ